LYTHLLNAGNVNRYPQPTPLALLQGNTTRRLSMKKSKLLVLGLIAMMLAGGLALASCGGGDCDKGCGNPTAGCSDKCEGKSGPDKCSSVCN